MLLVYRACSALCASQLAMLALAMALHGPSTAHLVSVRFAEELSCAPASVWRNASAFTGSALAGRWVVHEYPLQVDAWVALSGLCAGLYSAVYMRLDGRGTPENDSAEVYPLPTPWLTPLGTPLGSHHICQRPWGRCWCGPSSRYTTPPSSPSSHSTRPRAPTVWR